MKLWVDDVRPPPDRDTWLWAKTASEAIAMIQLEHVAQGPVFEEMSLDHDLGEGVSELDHGVIYDTKPIIYWLIDRHEQGHSFWPDEVLVHSSNPPGATWLREMIKRYKP